MQHRGIETPDCMAGRPVDHRGFPVPWFVTRKDEDGRWDFASVDSARFVEAKRKNLCWVSGTPLGRWKSFVIGPMCLINRVSAEPPVRRDVALWSVRICPFLSRPGAQRDRRLRDLVDENGVMEGQRGVALARNPGVSMVYTTGDVDFHQGLCFLGEPREISFWREGREATPAEIWTAIDTGFPALAREAEAEGDEAVIELGRYLARAIPLLPPRPQEDAA